MTRDNYPDAAAETNAIEREVLDEVVYRTHAALLDDIRKMPTSEDCILMIAAAVAACDLVLLALVGWLVLR